jgi:hypothetical protein
MQALVFRSDYIHKFETSQQRPKISNSKRTARSVVDRSIHPSIYYFSSKTSSRQHSVEIKIMMILTRKNHISSTNFKGMFLCLTLIVVLQLSGLAEAKVPCHICGEEGNHAISFPHVILEGVGQTCTQISVDVAVNVPIDSKDCKKKQNEWGDKCCSGERPDGSDPPTGLPQQDIPTVRFVGPHPVCNVCRDGDYPYEESMVINFLYIGSSSCAQYYVYGREGRIEKHMCDPVKYFSYEPCGCGEFNPYFNPDHPANRNDENDKAPEGNDPSGDEEEDEKKARQVPDYDGKEGAKMAHGRGGTGRMRHRNRRGLKGAKMVNHAATLQ